jgi:hypothetical protein
MVSRNETVEAPLYEIQNFQHDLIPGSGPGVGGSNPLSPTTAFQTLAELPRLEKVNTWIRTRGSLST